MTPPHHNEAHQIKATNLSKQDKRFLTESGDQRNFSFSIIPIGRTDWPYGHLPGPAGTGVLARVASVT